MFTPNPAWGLFVVRVGIALVLTWFGSSQLLAPGDWVGYVPDWIVPLSPVSEGALVLANGTLEILCGVLILLGVYVRTASLLMGLHLVLIASSLGYNATAVRDWGLTAACFGLTLGGGGAFSLIPSKTGDSF